MEDRRSGAVVAGLYETRLAARLADVARLEQRHAAIAWARLGLFLGAAGLVALLGRESAPWLVVPLLLFVPLLFVHAHTLNARDRAARAAAFYQRGIARLTDAWHGTGARGERYRNPSHLYSEDLDLFGAGGLFELLVTTRTRAGEDTLAAWLLAPVDPATIAARQTAVAELSQALDLREELSVLGPAVDAGVRTNDLRAWAAAPSHLRAAWPRLVLPLVAAVSAFLVGQWIWTKEPPTLLLPALALQGLLALRFRHAAHHVIHGIEQRDKELRVLALLMQRIEAQTVQSPLLVRLRDKLRTTGRSPADEVRHLARLVDILSSGHNQIFAPISALLLLGTQLAFAAERWRARCGPAVPIWLEAVAEYEALAALGTFAAEHPDYPFPEMSDDPPQFVAEALAHPLVSAGVAVANDVALGRGAPHLMVISGSNMSGKSTLLRTIGLNAVLAQAGAPVRARRLVLSPLRIGATLRIQDSLQEGRSRFFAEITRVREVVELTATPGGVLFLLDELLSGTNSHDRLQGATSILSGLVARGAIGLATTHDLALTTLTDTLGERAVNAHFSDRFEEGTLHFDYLLKPGVVQTSNAIALMRAVGLEV